MASNQDKYGQNRNLWRKLYPIGAPRRAPDIIELVDPNTSVSYSLDLQKTIRHRDYFQIIQKTVGGFEPDHPLPVGEYDEGLVHFDNTSDETFAFNFTFSSTPYVVYTMEESAPTGSGLENINVFGFTKSTTGAIVGVSAPFSGTVRYRAAWASSFPAVFTSSFTSSFTASAGSTPVIGATSYTASYSILSATPSIYLNSPINSSGSGQPDVYLDPDEASITVSSTSGEISAPYSGAIDFIAYTL